MAQLLTMNENTTKEWSFEDDVRNYADALYQRIGITREKIESIGVIKVINSLKNAGISVSELCSIGHLTCRTPELYSYYLNDAVKAIELANRLETDTLIVLAGPDLGKNYEDSIELFSRSIEFLIPHAEKNGVRLALEPLHPMYKASLSFIVSIGDAIDFVESIDSPSLRIWLDTYHIWWDTNVYKNIERAKKYVLGVHLNDCLEEPLSLYDWTLPGKGVIPLENLVKTISSNDWNGIYSIEVISDRLKPDEYPQILEYCKKWFESIMAVN